MGSRPPAEERVEEGHVNWRFPASLGPADVTALAHPGIEPLKLLL
jgi:hypothetical protein